MESGISLIPISYLTGGPEGLANYFTLYPHFFIFEFRLAFGTWHEHGLTMRIRVSLIRYITLLSSILQNAILSSVFPEEVLFKAEGSALAFLPFLLHACSFTSITPRPLVMLHCRSLLPLAIGRATVYTQQLTVHRPQASHAISRQFPLAFL